MSEEKEQSSTSGNSEGEQDEIPSSSIESNLPEIKPISYIQALRIRLWQKERVQRQRFHMHKVQMALGYFKNKNAQGLQQKRDRSMREKRTRMENENYWLDDDERPSTSGLNKRQKCSEEYDPPAYDSDSD